jgi:integrase/recombinase XerD
MINMADGGRDQAVLAVLTESGCRVGELVSSKVGDVKVGDEFVKLTFRRGKTGLRTVPLKESIVYLNHWLEKHPIQNTPDAPLWVSLKQIPLKYGRPERGYKPMNENSVSTLVKRVAKKAGIKKNVYPHLFRHSCATELAKVGQNR